MYDIYVYAVTIFISADLLTGEEWRACEKVTALPFFPTWPLSNWMVKKMAEQAVFSWMKYFVIYDIQIAERSW